MGYTDIVESGLEISHEGVFVLDSIYKTLMRWAKNHSCKVEEKSYDVKKVSGVQQIKIKWEAGKSFSEYRKCKINIAFTGKDIKNITVKNKKKQHGNVQIKIDCSTEKDTGDVWSRKPITSLLREMYDKFVVESTKNVCENEVKGDIKDLVKDFKTALRC